MIRSYFSLPRMLNTHSIHTPSRLLLVIVTLVFVTTLTPANSAAQEVTGLSGWSLFLDPGHSRTENQGLYNYSEAEKVLRISLALREMLLSTTDIDTVYLSRDNDQISVSLSQRTDRANALAADFFHSIHSDAGPASANSTLLLHGGWRSGGVTVEKSPKGGKEMGDLMTTNLSAAMRVGTRGNYADRNFYQGSSVASHARQYPYLHVNRESSMASILSEGGFHTNPRQQQLNMNAEFKRLEAQSHYWSVLAYMGVDERPTVGIVTGVVTDATNGKPINGAIIRIGDSSYTTDSYESLFSAYSSLEEQLGNGFFYLENIPNGDQEVIFEADGYYSDTLDVQVLTDDFSFADHELNSNIEPFITSVSLASGESLDIGEPLVLEFSRTMNKASVENALRLTPNVEDLEYTWISGSTLRISSTNFAFVTDYTLEILDSATDDSPFAHGFDGDADGEAGGIYTLSFSTSPADIMAPISSDVFPSAGVGIDQFPIASIRFNEPLDSAAFDSTTMYYMTSGRRIPGELAYYQVGSESVLNYFPSEPLLPNAYHLLSISKHISDTLGNAIGKGILKSFPTSGQGIRVNRVIDAFDGDFSPWWFPSQSGSTTGYIGEATTRLAETQWTNKVTASPQAMRVQYGWNTSDSEHLIRVYRNSSSPTFSNNSLLQVFIFGDGSGNPFRFMLRDGNNQLEGSSWIPIDWIGWKLVTWNLATDPVVGWVNGNGSLNGNVYIDSFQLSYTQGNTNQGFIIFDDLRVAEVATAISNEDIDDALANNDLPNQIVLQQNYPNPFNPSTTIRFSLPEAQELSLVLYDMLGRQVDILARGQHAAGEHSYQLDASGLASGVYVYQLITKNGVLSKKMTLIK
jgi:N-acetylmuramoyl-L-alanine amidase